MAVISFTKMHKPLIKSLYKFKQLSGKHPVYNLVFILVARAGDNTYIDGLLKDFPHCVAAIEINEADDSIRLTLYFFPDNPTEDIIGSYAEYEGCEKIFLSQREGQGEGSSICTFRKGQHFELYDIDAKTAITPENVDLDDIINQHAELAKTYSEVQSSRYAVSRIWDFGEIVNESEVAES